MNNVRNLKNDIEKNAITHGSLPFWSWNDKLEPEELRRQIRVMKNLGMNGFFMHARCGLETEYLSEEWYECVAACINEAKKLGMEAWSYDENGWPSGFAGGKLLDDEKNHAKYLVMRELSDYPEEDGSLLGVYTLSGGILSKADIKSNSERFYAVYEGRDSSYVDTMNPKVTEKFIEATHEEYKKRIAPEDFGSVMPGFFTDEPQYFRGATPWSDIFPECFVREYGYSVYSALPAMFIDFDGAESFRYDYYRLCHILFIQNFIKPLYEWCEKNGCQITGHAIEEGSLSGQMWCCGGIMPFYEYEHIPGIDYLGRGIASDLSPKQLGSACAQLGKKKALTETFACCGWDVTPRELKRIAELQYVGGANMMCQHLYSYTERGQRKRDYPAHYSEHNPWQPYLADFDRYFNNLGYTLSLGEEYVTTLVIHPIHSAWMRYKRHLDAASIEELQSKCFELSGKLSGMQLPYHWGDETMMARLASVEDTEDGVRLRVGKCTYKYVIIPHCYTLDGTTAALLREFISRGGRIMLYGDAPYAVDGRAEDMSWLVSDISLEDIADDADAKLRGDECLTDLRMTVRNTENGRIFYIVNLSDREKKNITLSVKNCAGICMLDMDSLDIGAADYECVGDVLVAGFDLEPAGSVVFVESDAFKPEKRSEKPDKGIVLPDRMTLANAPQNCIALDCAELSYDGVNFSKMLPVPCIKDKLYHKRYEGRIYLRYRWNTSFLPSDISVAVEPMKNCRISVNGSEAFFGEGFWYDRTFKVADIADKLVIGDNEITVSFDYYQREHVYYVLFGGVSESLRNCLSFDTEIENIYLFGSFCVDTDRSAYSEGPRNSLEYSGGFTLTEQRGEIDMTDIVRDGYPFYGGGIDAYCDYEYDGGDTTWLVFDGRYAVAEISVNGQCAGVLMFENRIDLSEFLRKGTNRIGIKVYNAMRNLIGPHHRHDPEPLSVSPNTFSFEGEWDGENCPAYAARNAFVKFGIKSI